MIPEIGHFALVLTLFVALAQGLLGTVGAARGIPAWISFARPAAHAQFLLVTVSFLALVWSFLVKDFRCFMWCRTPTPNCRGSTAWRPPGVVTKDLYYCGY